MFAVLTYIINNNNITVSISIIFSISRIIIISFICFSKQPFAFFAFGNNLLLNLPESTFFRLMALVNITFLFCG